MGAIEAAYKKSQRTYISQVLKVKDKKLGSCQSPV